MRRSRIMHLALLALCLSMTAACSPPLVSLQTGPREYVATDYSTVLKRWTRSDDLLLFGELERALTVTSTYQSHDFRWAYTIRYAQDYRLTVPQRQRMLQRSLNAATETHEFFVALYGSEQKYNDIYQPNSAWIVRLIDSVGNEWAPTEVEAIAKPSLIDRRYYPYNTVWRKAFRVRFNAKSNDGRQTIAPTAQWFGLRFAGPWGNTDLLWHVKPASPDNPRSAFSNAAVSGTR